MGKDMGKIIAMPGSGSSPPPITPDQALELRGKMQTAVVLYMEQMQNPDLTRQELIEITANTITLIINLLSIKSDAVSVCCAARIIHDRMDMIRNTLLPPIIAGVPDFVDQEQGLVDLLLGDTGVVLEIYSSVLDDDQMQLLLTQFKEGSENANGGSEG